MSARGKINLRKKENEAVLLFGDAAMALGDAALSLGDTAFALGNAAFALGNATSDRQGSPRQGSPRQVSSRKASPRQGSSRQASPRQGSSTHSSPRQGSSTHSSPRQGSSRQNSPRQGSSRQNSPRQGSSRQNSPRQGSSTHSSPRQGSSTHSSPRQASSRQNSPRQASSRQNSPRQGSSTHSSPRQGSSRQNSPKHALPKAKPRLSKILTLKELKDLARERKITNFSNMGKEQLCKELKIVNCLRVNLDNPMQGSPPKVTTKSTFDITNLYCTPETAYDTVREYGVAIIPSLLSAAECNRMNEGMWKTLGELSNGQITEDNQESWNKFFEFAPAKSMLVQYYGVGHAQYVWDLRQNPKIINVFYQIWRKVRPDLVKKPEDLLVSFDGVAWHFPPEITGRGWYANKEWLHVDQSPTRKDFECIQSWVTGYDVNEGDATLNALVNSHHYFNDLNEKFDNKIKIDYFQLGKPEIDNLTKTHNTELIHVVCPKGSMVLWDSRTVHSGRQALKGRAVPNFRNVVYICMTPRALANEKALERKRKIFEDGRMTTHWPHKPKQFGRLPQLYGKEPPKIGNVTKATLSEIGSQLAGY
uniref:Uncharacterized protein n=1 Tax=viral metagenome TaxID=1070528 RepID=A0A6C0KUI6_9ZZZZ